MAEHPFEIEVDGSLTSFLDRAGDQWEAAAIGKSIAPRRIVFSDWATFAATLTPSRMELLTSLHDVPTASVLALALNLNRDLNQAHADVVALEGLGLITRTDAGTMSVEFDQIQLTITIGHNAPACTPNSATLGS